MQVSLRLLLVAAAGTAYSHSVLAIGPSLVAPAHGIAAVLLASKATSSLEWLAPAATATLTGYVFEDVNYGGGLGRPRSTANTSARSGARVELYDASGTFVSYATTDANGLYSFSVTTGVSYTLRVVNNTVTSSRNTTSATGLLPVQTYNGTTARVGGEAPDKVDAANGAAATTLSSLTTAATASAPGTIAQSQATVAVASTATAVTGPDFGFNFDSVVNTNDVATASGNNTQGSLRQFITNSNGLSGETSLAQVYTATSGTTTALATGLETSIFMIPNGAAVAGQRSGLTSGFGSSPNNGSGSAATITLLAALPRLTGTLVALDGSTQTRSTGDSNAAVTTSGSESTGPEVLINDNNQFDSTYGGGVMLLGNDEQLVSVGVYGSNLSGSSGQGVIINAGVLRAIIKNCTINSNGNNIKFFLSTSSALSAATITGNIIRDAQNVNSDGIEFYGYNSNVTISGNQLLRNAGYGIDFVGGSNTGVMITGNTFIGNGTNTTTASGGNQRAGIGIRSAGSNNNTISNNTFTNNQGAGIVGLAGTTGNIFSQNSFLGNGTANNTTAGTSPGLAIDLTATGNDGDGVTLNDSGDPDGYTASSSPPTTAANGLLNFPVIQTAVLDNGVLTLKGYARPNALVELYLAAIDPTYFGEGQTYLTNFTQAASAGTTGSVTTGAASAYSGTQANGLNQGADNTNTFTVTYSPTAAQLAALQASGAQLTSTATLSTADGAGNFGTSEFAGNVRVLLNPVPNSATNASIPKNTTTATTLNPSLSATANGYASSVTTSTTNTIASYTVSTATGGTLYYNGTAVTAATVLTDATKLTFVPTTGFTGNATFTYTATDANTQASTMNKTGSATATGAATYTIPVSAPLPVTLVSFVAIPAPTSVVLTWQTASELNNNYFGVERSLDGATFAAIGQVAGHGTVATAQSYHFVDAAPAHQAVVYYRLRQVEYSGNSTYSPVQPVAATGTVASFAIAPNPTEGTLRAQLPVAGAYCLIYNLLGQVQQRTYVATQEVTMDIATLPAGTYVLLVQPDQGQPLWQRFSKR